jgi:RNA polymerase sigma-70 factor, ECF subfamily
MTMLQPAAATSSPSARLEDAAVPDVELLERVRAGDAVAFELIMRRYNRRLFRLARSIVRNAAEAEDVVQETYLRAYARCHEFRGPHGFSAWLTRIAANEALGRLRSRSRVISLDGYLSGAGGDADVRRIETMASPQLDPERLTGNGELRRLLEAAIDALPDDFRVVFVLRAVEGLSVAETAESLSIRPETVKTRFHRARRLVQETLGARFESLLPATFGFAGARCDRVVAAVLVRVQTAMGAAPQGPRLPPD